MDNFNVVVGNVLEDIVFYSHGLGTRNSKENIWIQLAKTIIFVVVETLI